VCSTEVRLGLLLVATAASVACIDPSQPQISHKAAHIGAGANPNTRRNMPGTPTAHARHAYIDSARPQRTHAPSQAWTEASPICHKSAVSSRKERAAEKKKKKRLARYRRRVSARARKRPLHLHSSWCSGSIRAWRRGSRQVAPVCGAWAVASAAAGRVGGERHLGDACDARGHAAQRRRVRGE